MPIDTAVQPKEVELAYNLIPGSLEPGGHDYFDPKALEALLEKKAQMDLLLVGLGAEEKSAMLRGLLEQGLGAGYRIGLVSDNAAGIATLLSGTDHQAIPPVFEKICANLSVVNAFAKHAQDLNALYKIVTEGVSQPKGQWLEALFSQEGSLVNAIAAGAVALGELQQEIPAADRLRVHEACLNTHSYTLHYLTNAGDRADSIALFEEKLGWKRADWMEKVLDKGRAGDVLVAQARGISRLLDMAGDQAENWMNTLLHPDNAAQARVIGSGGNSYGVQLILRKTGFAQEFFPCLMTLESDMIADLIKRKDYFGSLEPLYNARAEVAKQELSALFQRAPQLVDIEQVSVRYGIQPPESRYRITLHGEMATPEMLAQVEKLLHQSLALKVEELPAGKGCKYGFDSVTAHDAGRTIGQWTQRALSRGKDVALDLLVTGEPSGAAEGTTGLLKDLNEAKSGSRYIPVAEAVKSPLIA